MLNMAAAAATLAIPLKVVRAKQRMRKNVPRLPGLVDIRDQIRRRRRSLEAAISFRAFQKLSFGTRCLMARNDYRSLNNGRLHEPAPMQF